MLYNSKEIILPETHSILYQMMQDSVLDDFFLVGDTALALQINHRLSVDLDLFSTNSFDNQYIEEHLLRTYHFNTDFVAKNTLKGFISGIKIDLITHSYPLINLLVFEDGLRLASTLDIGAMKLNAISHSGNRQKDLYDLYFLLEHHSLKELLSAYKRKYSNSNPIIPLRAITWFEEIDFEIEKPMLVKKVTFKEVTERLLKSTQFPDIVF